MNTEINFLHHVNISVLRAHAYVTWPTCIALKHSFRSQQVRGIATLDGIVHFTFSDTERAKVEGLDLQLDVFLVLRGHLLVSIGLDLEGLERRKIHSHVFFQHYTNAASTCYQKRC